MSNQSGEVRMLIDGELVEAASGKRFENINPATEEVLGEVADASPEDMKRAIASSRRAFDESDWSTNRALRKRCLEQLQAALESEREEYREELIAEVGTPRMMTFAAQLDWPLEEALSWPAKMIDEFAWERDLPDGNMMGMQSRRAVWKEPIGVIGAIVPWNYPLEVTLNKLGPDPRHRQHGDPQARARHARGTPPAWAAWWPRRPTSRPASSTSSPPRTTWSGRS